jgi:hypothetical protein
MNKAKILISALAVALPWHPFKFKPTGFSWHSNSKYKPHQGAREIARRKAQIERGVLKAS